MSLRNSSLLLSLKIKNWEGRKQDKAATREAEATHKTDQGVVSVRKKLLPGVVELEKIQTIEGQIRDFFRAQTLPWASDGARIISSQNHLAFMTEFQRLKTEFNSAVDEFILKYPVLRDAVRIKLGDLFNADEYPEPEKLRRKFDCQVRVFPVPDVNDFRVDLSDAERVVFIETMKAAENQVLIDCWKRLHEVVSHAAQQLSKPESRVHASTIESIEKLVEFLPKLNPLQDPQLESMRLEVKAVVDKVSAESIRASKTTKAETAEKFSEIVERMGAFMGVQNENE